MRKIVTLLGLTFLAVGATAALSSCGSSKPSSSGSSTETSSTSSGKESSSGQKKIKVALITDVGDIDDRSFNQGTWEGMDKYLKAKSYKKGKDYKYFRPSTVSAKDYLNSIDLAVTWGAEAIVCPGFLFEKPVYDAQIKYPDVKFMIEDGIPHDIDENGNAMPNEIRDNTLSLFFKEQECGFLAGYSAVQEGYKNLGYMGGMAVPAVKKFGIGYVAGAYYAAHELNVTVNIDDTHYKYLNSFAPSPTIKTEAEAWYTSGTDIIFCAAGGAGASVMTAGENTNHWMIGVDVDQSFMSEKVLTSAMKALDSACKVFLDRVFGEWKGGESVHLGAKENGVALPTNDSSWKFSKFTKDQYNVVLNKIKDGTINVPIDYAALKPFVEAQGGVLALTEARVNPQ